jgi:hypothetical protein
VIRAEPVEQGEGIGARHAHAAIAVFVIPMHRMGYLRKKRFHGMMVLLP